MTPQIQAAHGLEPLTHLSPCPRCGTTVRAHRECGECHRERTRRQHARERAVERNTILALYYPEEFERRGWAQAKGG
jgi:hypothetical protein